MAWIASLKIVLISSGVVALALAMKLSVPLVMEFIASHVPIMCSSFRSLLRPPYIYVLINGIIITIAASSRFHHDRDRSSPPKLHSESESEPESIVLESTPGTVYEQRDLEPPVIDEVMPAPLPAVVNGFEEAVPEHEPEPEVEDDREYEDKLVDVSRSTWTPQPKSAVNSDEIDLPVAVEKPLVTARFGHRKLARSSQEVGRPLRVSKPKRNDTLENTWKMITEGRSMPLSRHMKKSETGENHGLQINNDSAVDTSAAMVKSETFRDSTNQQHITAGAVSSSIGTGGKLRKEPSLSQDELNRRVEAFINKFNEEMRMQRQESLNQYMEMVKR